MILVVIFDERSSLGLVRLRVLGSELARAAHRPIAHLAEPVRVDDDGVGLERPELTIDLWDEAERLARRALTLDLSHREAKLFLADLGYEKMEADAWIEQYFDTDSEQVASARTTLGEIRSMTMDTELPDISEPLTLLRQYISLAESAP